MKHLNISATRTFLKLVDGLEAGQAKKIDTESCYMAVHVDVLQVSGKDKLVAVAHRYESNGDQVPDPDVEFWVTEVGDETWVVPTAIDNGQRYTRAVEFDGLKVTGVRPHAQADITSFCNTWMRNIREQQYL